MNMIQDGFAELWLFIKNMGHVFRLIFSLLGHNPKSIFKFFAKLVRRINETLAVFFANYRLNREDVIKNHDYFNTELKKLYIRTNGLHRILNTKIEFEHVGFSILLIVDSESERYALEGLDFFSHLTGENHEVIVGCSERRNVWTELKLAASKSEKIKLLPLTQDEASLGAFKQMVSYAKYEFVVLGRLQDWPRPDLLYRLQTSLELVKDPKRFILTCAEVAYTSHTQVYDVSRFTTFRAESLPYYFMKSSCHMLCMAKSGMDEIIEFDQCTTLFQLALNASRSNFELYTLPFELYHYRISSQDADEVVLATLQEYHRNMGIPLVLNSQAEVNPIYFPFRPNVTVNNRVHVVVLYKDNKDITIQCADFLKSQTYKNLAITFVDNNSSDLSIAKKIEEYGYETIRVDEPFNYSRLNNLGVSKSKHKNADSYLFLNNDVFLEPNAIEEMVRWISMPSVGVVGSLLTFEDGTIQHAGLFVDKVMNIYIPWEHQDIGLSLKSAKTGRALRSVEAVTGACLLMKRDVFEAIGGWDEIFYPISFSDTDLCRRVRRLGYKIIFTPDSKGVHLESKTRGYSLIEDYECSSWLFWMTEQKAARNSSFMGHHFLDIPELYRNELQTK